MDKHFPEKPVIVVIGGPNGAGKTTAAPELLKGVLNLDKFINADTIARGLSGFSPDTSALEAGKVMLKHIRGLAARKESFAFETTMASRSFAPWFADLKSNYSIHIVFLWLLGPDLAVQRVKDRVVLGGHSIPEDVIRRRYKRGIANFFSLYRPVCSSWRVSDNSGDYDPVLIARQGVDGTEDIREPGLWADITERWA